MSIKLLDENTINKIAAGEVIENPSNIVKELIENSIDSGASKIEIEIENGGSSKIKVTDDGKGFDKDDIKLAFMQHATSKIDKIDDLFTIDSYGFRGEALPSIASVSNVTLISKSINDKESKGNKYIIEYGKEKSFTYEASNIGTSIEVRDLFANLPARKKFLKGAQKESALVEDIIYKFALSNPNISFKLVIDGKQKYKSNGDGSLKNVIFSLYGKEIFDSLLEVDREINGINIYGYIAKPIVARNTKNDLIYFVNNRYVKNNVLSKAIESAYEEYLMQHKYPLAVLMVNIDKKIVDVNVHPKKLEVKFSNDELIYYAVYEAIHETLKSTELVHEEKLPFDLLNERDNERDSFNTSIEKEDNVEVDDHDVDRLPSLRDLFKEKLDSTVKIGRVGKTIERPFIEKTLSEDHKYIGQVFNTYILVEFEEKLYIIDQHAAHEKINFEKIMKEYRDGHVASQKVYPSIIIKLTPLQYEALIRNIEEFSKVGYEIETFGDNDIKVDAVPYNIFSIGNKNLLLDMIDSFANDENKTEYDSIVEKIASMSCKAAIKANHVLSEIEVKTLLRDLFKLDNPYNCPHGRPTIISLSKTEFEKRFGRIV